MSVIQGQSINNQEQVNNLSSRLSEKDEEIAQLLNQTKEAKSNEFDKQTLELSLIQYKHLQSKLEHENEQLREKIQLLINQQFENQKTLLKQKQQIQRINTNLHSLTQSIHEEDSPIKQVINQLIDDEGEIQKPAINLEQQMKMNEIKRFNNQLLQKISVLEDKQHNLIARQFQDAACLVKLKKEKQSLLDKLEEQGILLSQELQNSRLLIVPDTQILISNIFDEIPNLEQLKQQFEALLIHVLQLLLSQTSMQESAEPQVRSHRSNSSKRLDPVYSIFSEIIKLINPNSQRLRESIILGTQENQIYESFIYEKPQLLDKQTQTIEPGQENEEVYNCPLRGGITLQSAKSKDHFQLDKQLSSAAFCQSIEVQTDDNEYMLSSLTPLMLNQLHIKTEEDNINENCSEVMLKATAINELNLTVSQLREIIEQLTLQLNYVKKKWFASIDKCLTIQEELSRLIEIDSQYDNLSQRFLVSEKEITKQKIKFENLLTKYFSLEDQMNALQQQSQK